MTHHLKTFLYAGALLALALCIANIVYDYRQLQRQESNMERVDYPDIYWQTGMVTTELLRLRLALEHTSQDSRVTRQQQLDGYNTRLAALLHAVEHRSVYWQDGEHSSALQPLRQMIASLQELRVPSNEQRTIDPLLPALLRDHQQRWLPVSADIHAGLQRAYARDVSLDAELRRSVRGKFIGLLLGFALLLGLFVCRLFLSQSRHRELNWLNRQLSYQAQTSQDLALKLSHQASHDSLTELINRREFERRLQKLVDNTRHDSGEHTLLFLDLDNFKVVNDSCGHRAGDELLRQISRLFSEKTRRHDTLGRLGGDEFAILLIDCGGDDALRIAEAIRVAAEQYRFIWQDKLFNVNATIGMVTINPDADLDADLLSLADSACYLAKDQGRNRIQVYRASDAAQQLQHQHMEWYPRIKQALEEDLFTLFVQPIASTATPNSSSHDHCEILLRMLDQQGQVIPPGSFLAAAERYNLATQLDRWVIGATLRKLAANPDWLQRLSLCSINLSGPSLSDPGLLGYIRDQFCETQVPAQKICFEITETTAITALSHATRLIDALKALGCQFALDDFGSGISSFGYLKSLPVDYLKIDGMFVKDMLQDDTDQAMVKTINELGHIVGKKTIAEYVENQEILEALVQLKVDYLQGYHIGRPIPIDRLGELTGCSSGTNTAPAPPTPQPITARLAANTS